MNAAYGVDSAAFKQTLSRLAAGVCVVTTVGPGGQKIGLTATAVTSVSAQPPLILVCLGGWARALEPLRAGAPFIVHLLSAGQRDLAEHFAQSQADKFALVAHGVGLGGCPRLAEAMAWIECRPHTIVPAGDHTIVVGRVEALECAGEGAPLVYFQRQFHGLGAPGLA